MTIDTYEIQVLDEIESIESVRCSKDTLTIILAPGQIADDVVSFLRKSHRLFKNSLAGHGGS